MKPYIGQGVLIKTLGLINTKEIRENSLKTKLSINNENIIQLIDKSKEKQQKKQLELLENLGICTPFNNSFSNYLLQDINLDNIKKTMNKKFYDANEMKSIACALDSVFHSTYKYKAGFKIKQHINNLVQIGKASVEGVAMKGDFKSIEDAFVLKAPRTSSKSPAGSRSESLLHELTIGNALNELREYIPNFAYVYGGFKCSGPIVEESTKKVINWCNEKDSVRWIVYENIKGVDFADYAKTCTFEDWLNIYMQTLYSIHLANFMIDFTHYDLHDENIIVRDTELTKPMYIPYKTSNGVEYIKCKNISTVIDYGFSHAKINGENFGVWEHMEFGVYPTHGFQLHDAYKLLLMSMRSLYFAKNTEVLKKVSLILKFFNKYE